jgi:hypothetical protein
MSGGRKTMRCGCEMGTCNEKERELEVEVEVCVRLRLATEGAKLAGMNGTFFAGP